ncbi:MAG TPA: prolyl oligopeptidase family serine peptidase [Pseudogracilibacillus sp.]|nr:prolyl oligopeptidase family serine peptidase [Pseudogracilibacillus sp.]
MITIEKKYINEIPVLIIEETDKKGQALPTVVYYHGFNGEKESNLTLAYKMVEKGLRVVLPESVYHGERRHDATAEDIDMAFWQIVIQNIKELGQIKDYLDEKQLLLDVQIGVGGTSMGGITTYGALRTYDWIKTGAALMGTPYMTEYAKMIIDRFENNHGKTLPEAMINDTLEMLTAFDITKDLETLNNRPLFIWHGAKDAIVPVDHSRQFYEKVKSQYENTESLYYLEEADRIHNISKRSMDESAAWFEKYLIK